jgi:hypothetical protein
MKGGTTGWLRGLIRGGAIWLGGLMIIGGMVGGADGGPF